MGQDEKQLVTSNFAYDTDIVYIPTNIYEELNMLLKKYVDSQDNKYADKYTEILLNNKDIDIKKVMFSKIENQRAIDYILNSAFYISYDLRKKFAQDDEIVKIFIENNCDKIFGSLDEEELLREIDGITLIEHLIKNDLFSETEIRKIKSSRIIIDLLEKYDKKSFLKSVHENMLFENYQNEKLIDYILKNDMISKNDVDNIRYHEEIYLYLEKYNKTELMPHINVRILTQKINEKYVLDYLLEKDIKPRIVTMIGTPIFELIKERERYDLLENLSSHDLNLIPKGSQMKLIEILLSKGIFPKSALYAIKFEHKEAQEYFDLIKKYNQLKGLNSLDEKELLKTFDDEFLLETLLKKNIIPTTSRYIHPISIELLIKYGYYEELVKCTEYNLLNELPNGKKIYEEILDRNLTFKHNITHDEIVRKIVEEKKSYLYNRLTTTSLLKLYDLNNTYLDLILEESKTNKNINITRLVDDARGLEEKAKVYIIYAKHDLEMYLEILDKRDLLLNIDDKRFIDVLVELAPEELLEKIIPYSVRQNMEIAMTIKLAGKKQDEIKFESLVSSLEEEYLNNKKTYYEKLPLTPEQEEILNKLKEVMNDGKSDERMLEAFIASYRHLLATNSPLSNEIFQLIEAKTNNPDFSFSKVDEGAYFSPGTKKISMNDINIETLNHEMGHALYDMLTDQSVPEEFDVLLIKLQNDPEFMEKTSMYSKKFHQIKENVKKMVEEQFLVEYDKNLTTEKRNEISKYLDTLREEQKNRYIEKGYNPEMLDMILQNTFTVEEYIEQDRRIKKLELMNLILRIEYGTFVAIGDYFDGIHTGKLYGNVLIDKNGEKIKRTFGHGIEYYTRSNKLIFNEMIANYSMIAKSQNSQEGLKELKDCIGEELFELIENYYINQILESKKYNYNKTL